MTLRLPADKIGCLGPVEEYASPGCTPSTESPSKEGPSKEGSSKEGSSKEGPSKLPKNERKERPKNNRGARPRSSDDGTNHNVVKNDTTRPATSRPKQTDSVVKRRTAERTHGKSGSKDGASMKSRRESCYVDDLESVLQITHYSSYDGKFVVPSDSLNDDDDADASVTPSQRNGFAAVPYDSIRITKDRRNAKESHRREDSVGEIQEGKHKSEKHRDTREGSGSEKLRRKDSKMASNARDIYCRNINRPSVDNMVMDAQSGGKVKQKLSVDGGTPREDEADDNSLKQIPNTANDKEVMTLWKNRHHAENEEKVNKIAKKKRPDASDNKDIKTLWTCDDKKIGAMKEIIYESVNENKAKVKKNKTKADRMDANLDSRMSKSNRTPVFGSKGANNVYIVAVADEVDTNTTLPEYATAGTAKMDREGSISKTSFVRGGKKTKSKKGNKMSRFDVKDGVSKSEIMNRSSFNRLEFNSFKEDNKTIRTQMSTNKKSRSPLIAKSVSIANNKSIKARRTERDKKTMDWTGTEKYVGIPSNSEYPTRPRMPTRQTHELNVRPTPPNDSKDFKYVAEVYSTDPDEPTREQLRRTISQLNGSPDVMHTYESSGNSQVARPEQRTSITKRNDRDETPIRLHTPVENADPTFGRSQVVLSPVSNGPNERLPIEQTQATHPNDEDSARNSTYPLPNPNDKGPGPSSPGPQFNIPGNRNNSSPICMNSNAKGRGVSFDKSPLIEENQQNIALGTNVVDNQQHHFPTMNHASRQEHNSPRTNSDASGEQMHPAMNPYDFESGQHYLKVSDTAATSPQNQSTINSYENNRGQMYPKLSPTESGRGQTYHVIKPGGENRGRGSPQVRPNVESRGQVQTSLNSHEHGRGKVYPKLEPHDERQRQVQPTLVQNNLGHYPTLKPHEDVRGKINPPLSPHIIIERGSAYPVNFDIEDGSGSPMNPAVNGRGSAYPVNPNVRGSTYPLISNDQGPSSPHPYVNIPGHPASSPEGERGSGHISNPSVSFPHYPTHTYENGRGTNYPVSPNVNGQGYPMYHNRNGRGSSYLMQPTLNAHPLNPNLRVPVYPIPPNENERGSPYTVNPNINKQCFPVNPNVSVPVYPHQFNGNVNGSNYPIRNTGNGHGSAYPMNPNINEQGFPLNPNFSIPVYSYHYNGNLNVPNYPIHKHGNGLGSVYPMNPAGSGQGSIYPTMNAAVLDTWIATNNKGELVDSYEGHQKRKPAISSRGDSHEERDPNSLFGDNMREVESLASCLYQTKRNKERDDSSERKSCSVGGAAIGRMKGRHSHHQDAFVPCGCGQQMRFVFALKADDATDCAVCLGQLKEEFSKLLEAYKRKGYDGCCCKEDISVTQLALEYLRGDTHACGHGRKAASEMQSVDKERVAANKRCEERKKILERYVQQRCKSRQEPS